MLYLNCLADTALSTMFFLYFLYILYNLNNILYILKVVFQLSTRYSFDYHVFSFSFSLNILSLKFFSSILFKFFVLYFMLFYISFYICLPDTALSTMFFLFFFYHFISISHNLIYLIVLWLKLFY